MGDGWTLDGFHLRNTSLPGLLRDAETWRPVAVDTSGPELLGWLRWGWAQLMAGSYLPCRCVHSFVGHFKSRQEREAEMGARAMEFTNIYVKNLQVNVDEQGLQELFSQFGGCVSQGQLGVTFSSTFWSCQEEGALLGLPEDWWEGRGMSWGFPNSPLSQVGPSQGRC